MSVLDEAATVVHGDREKTYGNAAVNVDRIRAIWQQILGVPVTRDQVCLCMIGLKLARLSNDASHRDSLVDVCGYAALMELCQEQEKEAVK